MLPEVVAESEAVVFADHHVQFFFALLCAVAERFRNEVFIEQIVEVLLVFVPLLAFLEHGERETRIAKVRAVKQQAEEVPSGAVGVLVFFSVAFEHQDFKLVEVPMLCFFELDLVH